MSSLSEPLLFYILMSPLAGALFSGLMGRRVSPRLCEVVSCLAPIFSFVLVFFLALARQDVVSAILISDWLPFGTTSEGSFSVALYVDDVAQLMLLLVTGVGSLIHLYSVGYMSHDKSRQRFFAYLNLFVFFMLLLVMSNSLLTLFVGWEGVGLCSYLLIGFWFEEKANAIAGKKAFIVNRVGDAGFILGMLILLSQFGTLNVHGLLPGQLGLADLAMEPTYWITAATLLLFIGAMGKSAQFPLLVWLPDAMAGPTPVSALIHAATMVTAGVYMVIRLNFLFVLAPATLEIVAMIGLITAFLAACAAIAQNDIKKILAYSTVSQLGYMFLGLGVGAFSASLFHLVTHGFFKALLFLSAGSVIHAMHGEQNIERMGGLKNYIIPTTLCFLAGGMALSGFPFLSGWFSKGAILGACYEKGYMLYWGVGILTAMITAMYSVRLFVRVFLGTTNVSKEKLGELHESPPVMILPMALLAVLSLIGGVMGIHHLAQGADPLPQAAGHHLWPTVIESICILIAMVAAWIYFMAESRPRRLVRLKEVAYQNFYLDQLVTYLVGVRGTLSMARLSRWLEVHLVDSTIQFTAGFTQGAGTFSSVLQRSNVKAFLVMMLVGVVALLWLVLWKA